MTDDRLNVIRELADFAVRDKRDMQVDPRTVLSLLDMIERQRVEIEQAQERTVEDLL